ncbi:MAG TPA: SDR family oxidoreductase [Frateuria sp.]|uniref:SDR family oxidoreductase n=1 Tax=Frateuria sp. TaxID=2211372 RepID=UPI002D7FF1D8|nr:SDR family oxidoreductase [Frateuria sp.]HET6805610.1 SDR family oxidoreductase [Frateuria sp.]
MAARLKPLDQQVMVITGASSGIGLCTALLAAEKGARLVLAARSGETLEAIAAQIGEAGGEALAVPTDVGERGQLQALAAAAVKRFGRIDTWVNDAGVAIYGRLDEVSESDSRRLFDTNFWGVVNGSLVALPHLRESGGALINIGSEVSDAVIPFQGMYSASKHAVKGFTDALRVEVEELDGAPVSITLIQPTAVDTPYPQHARNYMSEEPKLPSPMIDPHRVAEAILEAATEGGRDVTVGAMAKLDTAVSKLLPSLGDKMAAMQAHRQQRDVPARAPEGALFRAGGGGQVYGREAH